jgi:hypothetical protein
MMPLSQQSVELGSVSKEESSNLYLFFFGQGIIKM